MATTSSAGGGTSMGNAQMGTRGLSAGDWVRLQRLKQANTYLTTIRTNEDILAVPSAKGVHPHSSRGTLALNGIGISKIRRPGSSWTEYIAASTGDYVLPSQAGPNTTSIRNTLYKVCSCTVTGTVVATKAGSCTICGYSRLRMN